MKTQAITDARKAWSTTTGIYSDISNAEYHADQEAVSKSGLDQLNRSPMHYQHHLQNRSTSSSSQALGHLLHAMVLEPETVATNYFVPPTIARRSKANREEWADMMRGYMPEDQQSAMARYVDGEIKAAEIDDIVARYATATPISADQMEVANIMGQKLVEHPAMQFLMEGAYCEQTVTWADDAANRQAALDTLDGDLPLPTEPTGIRLKARPDLWRMYGDTAILADLKTTRNASSKSFSRDAYLYRYYVQAALYSDGFKAATGTEVGSFAFVCIETAPPYAVAVYRIDDASIEAGRIAYLRNLTRLHECRQSNDWPSYGDSVIDLTLPGWAFAEVVEAAA